MFKNSLNITFLKHRGGLAPENTVLSGKGLMIKMFTLDSLHRLTTFTVKNDNRRVMWYDLQHLYSFS